MSDSQLINPLGSWRYFGRGGKDDPFEIYRLPDDGHSIAEVDRSKYPERLRKTGVWKHDTEEDNIVWYEELTGDFSWTENEINENDVVTFFQKWAKTGWPGRE